MINLQILPEYKITQEISFSIQHLLNDAFSDFEYHHQDYFKQLPHHRLLAFEKDQIIGHLGLDLRIMNLNGNRINVLGIIDFCVEKNQRSKGIGSKMLRYLKTFAIEHNFKIDAIFLVTENPAIYLKNGFSKISFFTEWLKINNGVNLGLGKENIDDVFFMYWSVNGEKWEEGRLDMLGYMY